MDCVLRDRWEELQIGDGDYGGEGRFVKGEVVIIVILTLLITERERESERREIGVLENQNENIKMHKILKVLISSHQSV